MAELITKMKNSNQFGISAKVSSNPVPPNAPPRTLTGVTVTKVMLKQTGTSKGLISKMVSETALKRCLIHQNARLPRIEVCQDNLIGGQYRVRVGIEKRQGNLRASKAAIAIGIKLF